MATRPTPRVGRSVLQAALAAAPRNYSEASTEAKEAFAQSWTDVTRQPVKDTMRLSLAVILRVHGEDSVRILKVRFAATGITNLIIEMLRPDDGHVDETSPALPPVPPAPRPAPVDQRETEDLWEGWRQPLPGSVVEAVDKRPRRTRRPSRP